MDLLLRNGPSVGCANTQQPENLLLAAGLSTVINLTSK
jgi:hypothetical protein